jgi:hypothetical protein
MPILNFVRLYGPRVSRWLWAPAEKSRIPSLLVAALFGIVLSYVHYHHELWRDEIHCWAVGRNATGLLDLAFGPRRYDGHPLLWYYVTHLASRVVPGAFGLHAVAVGIAVASTYLWFRHSGFPRLLRLLLLPTYYFFYEYGVIARSYGLGMLLVFAFCALYRRERPRYAALAIVLVLLAFTSLYGALCTMALAPFLFAPRRIPAGSGRAFAFSIRGDGYAYLAGLAILAIGGALVAYTTLPPADAYYAPTWQTKLGLENLRAVGARYWQALLANSDDWWVSKAPGSDSPAFQAWLPFLGGGLFLACVASLWRVPMLALAYAFGIIAMALFQETKYPGGMRHIGHFFILLLACGWLMNRELARVRRHYLEFVLLLGIFAVQINGALKSTGADLERTFSGAGDAAAYLRPQLTQEAVVIGSADHPTAAVAAYLDRAFLFADTGDFVKTVVFHNRRVGVDTARLFTLAKEQIDQHRPVFFILHYPIGAKERDGLRVKLLHVTRPPIVQDERFYIYRVGKVASSQTGRESPTPLPG